MLSNERCVHRKVPRLKMNRLGKVLINTSSLPIVNAFELTSLGRGRGGSLDADRTSACTRITPGVGGDVVDGVCGGRISDGDRLAGED